MMRSLALLVALALVLSAAPAAGFGWSISGSATDGCINTGDFVPGPLTLYLWFNWSQGEGFAALFASAEMTLISDNPANVILAFTPTYAFWNLGTATHLLLTQECRMPGIMAGSISVSSNAPGGYCIGGDLNVTVDCGPNALNPNSVTGFSTDGSPPCIVDALGNGSDGCQPGDPVSVEPSSWGSIKGLYR